MISIWKVNDYHDYHQICKETTWMWTLERMNLVVKHVADWGAGQMILQVLYLIERQEQAHGPCHYRCQGLNSHDISI